MRYRADIDGLRAFAVGSVVLYHADYRWLPGGFTGVDVFFVISGYLITRLIAEDVAQGRFSLRNFYERRARRILPALFVVLSAATAAAVAWLAPADLAQFGQSLAATAVFGSNIWFWQHAGYFDAPVESAPLLHTWSLAVEEQFYLLYPLVLVALLTRLRRALAPVLICAMLVSIAIAEWGAIHRPSAAFYLLPTRAWELLCGAVLALGLVPAVRGRIAAELLAWGGLASIVAGFVLLSGDSRFPGLHALPACLGAAALIHAGSSVPTRLSALLSMRGPVLVGLISYSLYLWHWVLFVFAKHFALRELVLAEKLGLIALSVLAAGLSWRFVEVPLRRPSRQGLPSADSRRVLAAAGASSMAVIVAGLALDATGGLPGRLSPQALAYAQGEHSYWAKRDDCDGKVCEVGRRTPDRPAVLLWGDSHAAALAPAVAELAEVKGTRAFVAYKKICAPLVGYRDHGGGDVRCDDFIAEVLSVVERERVRTVVLHARWAWYVEGTRNEAEGARHLQLSAGETGPDANARAFERLLGETVQRLHALGVRVDILSGVPEVGVSVPELAAQYAQLGRTPPVIPREPIERRQARAQALIEDVARRTAASVVPLRPLLCDDAACTIARDGRVLYHDDDHLSVEGARAVRPALEAAFGDVPASPAQPR